MGFPRADEMVIAKTAEQTQCPIDSCERVISRGGRITEDDGCATDKCTCDLDSADVGNIFWLCRTKVAVSARRWRGTDPNLMLA